MGNVSNLQEKRAQKRETRELAAMQKVIAMPLKTVAAISVASPKTIHHTVDLRRVVAWAQAMMSEHSVVKARINYAIAAYEFGNQAVLLIHMPHNVVMVMAPDGVYRLDQYPQPILEMTIDGQLGRWEMV